MYKKMFFCSVVLMIMVFNPVYAVECVDYYYGLGVTQDYKKAYDCLTKEKEPDIILLVMMCLNGEGVERSPKKAMEAIEAHDKREPYNKGNVTMRTLREYVNAALKNPGDKGKKLEYGDLAMTTFDMNIWSGILNRIEAQEKAKERDAISKSLPAEAKNALEELQKLFDDMKSKDSDRVYTEHESGSNRRIAASGFESYLMDRNSARITGWIKNRKLTKADKTGFENADKELNEIYQRVLKNADEVKASMESYDKDDAERWLTQYTKELKAAQRAWIKYRDQWVVLIKLVKPDGLTSDEAVLAVKTALTKERSEELLYDPVAPTEGEVR